MNSSTGVGIYRRLLRFYPRRFRDEYGADMALLFADQLRDEPASRVWTRAIVDLAITVPTQQLEAHMNRPPNTTVPVVFAALSITGVLLTIVGGSNRGVAALGLAAAVVFGALAAAAWRHTRAVATARPARAQWWKILGGGLGVLATTIVVLNVVGEVKGPWWWPMMLTLAVAVLTTVTGLVLGIAHLTEDHPRNAAS